MASATQDLCHVCNSPAVPSLACKHIEEDGSTSTTPYCSQTCTDADSKSHEAECRNASYRRQLHQTGRLLRDVLMSVRRKFFDYPLTISKMDGGKILIDYEGEDDQGDDIFWEYAGVENMTPDDEAALLTYMECGTSTAYFTDFIRSALEDCVDVIFETKVQVPEESIRVREQTTDGIKEDTINHLVLTVKLKDGNVYVLDIAGAQYGQMRLVVPYRDYFETAELSGIPQELGTDQAKFRQQLNALSNTEHKGNRALLRRKRLSLLTAEVINRNLKTLQMQKVVRMTEEDFEVKRAEFMAVLSDVLDARIQEYGSYSEMWRLFTAEGASVLAALGNQEDVSAV